MIKDSIQALSTCETHGFDFAEVYRNQWLLTERRDLALPGFTRLELEHWTLCHGPEVELVPMRDKSGVLFGVFIGIGVDPDGQFITAKQFTAFDCADPDFLTKFAAYIAYTAGRFMVVIDHAETARCYFDAAAHMTTLYNAKTRTLASSAQLTIDRPVDPDPMFDWEKIAQASTRDFEEGNYILGHSLDRDVAFALPNRYLDLGDFSMTRIWPLPDSFPLAEPADYDAVLTEIVNRLRTILAALIGNRPCVMPISGGTDSRKLVACAADHLDEVALFFAFEHTGYARLDAATGAFVAQQLGIPFTRFTREDAAARFGTRPFDRRQAIRKFGLRTSHVARAPNEVTTHIARLTPEGHLHLRGNVMDLTRSIWWRSFGNRHKKLEPGLKEEIATLFLFHNPPDDLVAKWAPDYTAWKDGLPANAQALIYDFIFLELFLHVSSAKYYGFDNNFYINPFADRRLIELTLRFPVDHRFDGHLNARFLEIALPKLADLPYRGGVQRLMESGKFDPAETA